jgi:hypothetical protein
MMRIIATIFALLLFSFHAAAEECPPTPDGVKRAIENHINKLRADEYGKGDLTDSGMNITDSTVELTGLTLGPSDPRAA